RRRGPDVGCLRGGRAGVVRAFGRRGGDVLARGQRRGQGHREGEVPAGVRVRSGRGTQEALAFPVTAGVHGGAREELDPILRARGAVDRPHDVRGPGPVGHGRGQHRVVLLVVRPGVAIERVVEVDPVRVQVDPEPARDLPVVEDRVAKDQVAHGGGGQYRYALVAVVGDRVAGSGRGAPDRVARRALVHGDPPGDV